MAADERERQIAEAYDRGRRAGFGVAALALSCVAFLSLLGAEKAILAIVLGVLATRGGEPRALARRLGIAAISLGSVFLVAWGVGLVIFWDKFVELIKLLQQLS